MDAASPPIVCGDKLPARGGIAARRREQPFRCKCAESLSSFEADGGPNLVANPTRLGDAEAEESPASEWACY